ncbi:protein kinase [Penaeus vannamei]|uniref:Protein kinase n=1 Tax=Penaeus vannamei TaxID=6689 RepID=A0A3R7MQ01_PENVA|nr:protein kinase [Penaeus vannamei]
MARPCRTLGQLARELQRTDPRRRPALSAVIRRLDWCFLFGCDSESEAPARTRAKRRPEAQRRCLSCQGRGFRRGGEAPSLRVPSSNTKGVEIRRSGLGCCLQSHRFRASSNGARRQEARDPCSRGRLSEVTPPQRRQGGTRRGRAGRHCWSAGATATLCSSWPSGERFGHFQEEFKFLKKVGGAGGSPRALGICSNPPAILCSFVGRSTLEKVLEESKCSDEELLRLSRSLCVAVQEVHGRGVIHNDLMDDNVVVDKATGRVHVIDFGTACRPGHDCGFSDSSNDYLAPEILGGGPSTAASDAFSVGAMLELISDQMARPCRTLGQLARELQRTDPRRRPALSAVIRRLDCAVKEELGEGASGKALLVRWGDGDAVLKLAHSGERFGHFQEEFKFLKKVGGAGGSPRALGICSNPPAILCSFVGRSTLEKVLEESKCSDESCCV